MSRRKTPGRRTHASPSVTVGVAWYRRDQWQRLHEIADDRDGLDETYEQWLRGVRKLMREMHKLGRLVEKVDVDIEELLLWCQSHSYPVTSQTRAEYVAAKLHELYEGSSHPT